MTETITSVFYVVVMQSCKAGLVICAILLFCSLLGKRLSPTTRFAVWLLVPLTLLLYVSVPSPFSVWNAVYRVDMPGENLSAPDRTFNSPGRTLNAPDRTFDSPGRTLDAPDRMFDSPGQTLNAPDRMFDSPGRTLDAPDRTFDSPGETFDAPDRNLSAPQSGGHVFLLPQRNVATLPDNVAALPDNVTAHPSPHSALCTLRSALPVWLTGCIIMTLIFLRQGMICRRWIRRAKLTTDARVLTIFEQCVRTMRVKTWLVVTESSVVSGPFLIGVLRPTLLLPESLARNATDEQLRTVFLHELAHLKRWDIWTSWLMTCLLIVHWFNPLLWLAVRRLNDAREEACDALALAGLNPRERKNYGLSLVDIATQFQSPIRTRGLQTPGLVGISESGKILTRRIEMIRDMGTWKIRWTLIAALFALLLGAVTLTDAQQPLTKQQIRSQIEMLERDIQQLKEAEIVAEDDPEESSPRTPFQGKRVLHASPTRDSSESKQSGTFDDFYGKYTGFEGDKPIAFELYRQLVTLNVPGTMGDGQIVYMPLTTSLAQIVIYKNGFPHGGGFTHDDDWYSGSYTLIKENELTICLYDYYMNNNERKTVPEALKELTAKVIRDGDDITLEIPKNDEWEEVRVTKVKKPEQNELNKQIITVYVIKNADPKTVLSVMQTMLAGMPEVHLQLDPKTNDLIVLGTEAVHVKVREILKTLDKQKEEVPTELKPTPAEDKKPVESQTSDYVWDKFGIRVAAVTQDEFLRRMADVKSPYVFEGALEVLEVKPDGIFSTLNTQKGDLLCAIITPKDPWNTTRVGDLKWIAECWTPEEMGGDEVKVIVVRDKKLLEGRVTVKTK